MLPNIPYLAEYSVVAIRQTLELGAPLIHIFQKCKTFLLKIYLHVNYPAYNLNIYNQLHYSKTNILP